jgi:hypothetical protein
MYLSFFSFFAESRLAPRTTCDRLRIVVWRLPRLRLLLWRRARAACGADGACCCTPAAAALSHHTPRRHAHQTLTAPIRWGCHPTCEPIAAKCRRRSAFCVSGHAS